MVVCDHQAYTARSRSANTARTSLPELCCLCTSPVIWSRKQKPLHVCRSLSASSASNALFQGVHHGLIPPRHLVGEHHWNCCWPPTPGRLKKRPEGFASHSVALEQLCYWQGPCSSLHRVPGALCSGLGSTVQDGFEHTGES